MMAVRIYVSGKVQGVGFRFYTKQVAETYGLLGYVKNLPDGRVEIFSQGDEEVIWRFIRDIWKGPKHSEVVSINIVKEETNDKVFDFRIVY